MFEGGSKAALCLGSHMTIYVLIYTCHFYCSSNLDHYNFHVLT